MSKHKFGKNRSSSELSRHGMEEHPMPVACKVQSFARFSRWIDGELAKLERRWRHNAAPAARQPLARISLTFFQSQDDYTFQKPKKPK